MTDEEKEAIEYLKVRLYGNEGCKSIDVAQRDLRIFLKLIDRTEKEIESWKKYSNEQEENITGKNNKICDLEFEIENKDKVIDLMAKTLKWSFNTGLGLIPSSICDCEGDIRNCEDKICTDCIKEYFKKKVGDK